MSKIHWIDLNELYCCILADSRMAFSSLHHSYSSICNSLQYSKVFFSKQKQDTSSILTTLRLRKILQILNKWTKHTRYVHFLQASIVHLNKWLQYLTVDGTRLRKNPVYYKIYLIYMNLIIHGLIPLLLLAFLNTNVLLSLREAFKVEKKCDNYTTFFILWRLP